MRVSPSPRADAAQTYSPGLSPTRPNSATRSLCALGAFPRVHWYGTALRSTGAALVPASFGDGAVSQPANSTAIAAMTHLQLNVTCVSLLLIAAQQPR